MSPELIQITTEKSQVKPLVGEEKLHINYAFTFSHISILTSIYLFIYLRLTIHLTRQLGKKAQRNKLRFCHTRTVVNIEPLSANKLSSGFS